MGRLQRRTVHRVPYWPLVAGAVYLLALLAITFAEYFSERSKLMRGTFTDTFSPFAYTHLFSVPVSAWHSDWAGYPEQFDKQRWLGILREALPSVIVTVVLQALLVTTILVLLALAYQRSHNPER